MTTLTLQEAIFTVSNLRTQLNKEYTKFDTEYRVPIAVNNESVVKADKKEDVKASLNKIETVKQDIIALKAAIHVKNTTGTINIDGQEATASEVLESLKLERDIVNNLQNNTSFGYSRERIKTVSGVGIVEEGIINEAEVLQYIEEMEVTVHRKSMLIDKFNSTETVEVTLQSL
ncbi:hypothetical protein JEOAER750_00125 [Jeotgalicoccus aerolatus]|uniref:Glycerol-3-phosphate cytidylyltransferase-like family protein n=2 Tax=Jeotgalicoccus aerolatus TaxID=709510 RepID=A0ABS4HMF4_9STAP|nr:hypothetical protein [Jeotgalicoccus aerolatus]MBP1952104.1 glycerol-3-phosphate cytidylyltransferase-like family protein [Jeotgalicoccus aerolatus]NMA81586.1 hypothetical protein [Jeotgalicoccus aerolatus]CAD2070991.1 hypothetical protein JEOAER750_00125 [Jeotgalicoccus aerolatus]GGE05942.1 hypothetical protein GCM10007273_17980 [Jeotgalicoccus aerolatus]HJG32106.1 hypothetical protein [Jeotgalicoccus aerolatus]